MKNQPMQKRENQPNKINEPKQKKENQVKHIKKLAQDSKLKKIMNQEKVSPEKKIKRPRKK